MDDSPFTTSGDMQDCLPENRDGSLGLRKLCDRRVETLGVIVVVTFCFLSNEEGEKYFH